MPSLFSGFAANTTLRYRSTVHIDTLQAGSQEMGVATGLHELFRVIFNNSMLSAFPIILKTLVNDLINYELRSLHVLPRAPGRG